MVKIRLRKIGRKRVNAFRIQVVDSRRARDTGAFIEDLGFYQPQSAEYLSINVVQLNFWLSKGAEATARVMKLAKIASENQSYVRVSKG